ncbi:TPA: SdpI family protein [Enterococcus faecalis]|nr:SdpI family protein [Enterococcus faecalis]HCT9166898.1 SdpI family protein [Enterococcus faecalis]
MNIGILLLIVSVAFIFINLFSLNSSPNHMFGYRTKRSMSSDKNWHLAQNIFFPTSIVFILLLIVLHKNILSNNSIYNILCLISYVVAAIITEYILSKVTTQ